MTEQTLFIDGADSAIVGFHQRCGEPPVVIYDYEMLLKHFMNEGMNEEEAAEWIEFNVVGAWCGKGTPAVMHQAKRSHIEEILGT